MEDFSEDLDMVGADDESAEDFTPEPAPKKPCTACERLAGLAGVLLGAALLGIALDLATGGRISAMVNRKRELETDD